MATKLLYSSEKSVLSSTPTMFLFPDRTMCRLDSSFPDRTMCRLGFQPSLRWNAECSNGFLAGTEEDGGAETSEFGSDEP